MERPMKKSGKKTGISQMSGREYPMEELVPVSMINGALLEPAKKRMPGWDPNGYISIVELNHLRHEHVERMLQKEKGEMTQLEREVIKSIKNAEILSKNIETDIKEHYTLGERVADNVATFGGSWRFIFIFAGFIQVWISINVYVLATRPYDPYPFILLNLILSCLAAIQAPVIMMSQNRQESKDRTRSENDYQVNLKAELEIKQLHEKLDHIIIHHNRRILEIQQIQIDLLEEIIATLHASGMKKK
jgi:uncharacterized membrane protein